MEKNISSNFAIAILVLVAACVGFAFWVPVALDDIKFSKTEIFYNSSNQKKNADLPGEDLDIIIADGISLGEGDVTDEQTAKFIEEWKEYGESPREEEILDHPMIGQVFSAGGVALYAEGCNSPSSCSGSKRSIGINRTLYCGEPNSTITSLYNNSYQVSQDTTFELIELFRVKRVFSSGHTIAVLKDSNGLLSTNHFSHIGEEDNPLRYQNGEICTLKYNTGENTL